MLAFNDPSVEAWLPSLRLRLQSTKSADACDCEDFVQSQTPVSESQTRCASRTFKNQALIQGFIESYHTTTESGLRGVRKSQIAMSLRAERKWDVSETVKVKVKLWKWNGRTVNRCVKSWRTKFLGDGCKKRLI